MAEIDIEKRLDNIFHALADQTRRALLTAIAGKECRVTELAEPFDMSLNAISKHLKVLEKAGLLTRTKDGRVHRCRLNGAPLKDIDAVITFYKGYWENQFDHLESVLNKFDPKDK